MDGTRAYQRKLRSLLRSARGLLWRHGLLLAGAVGLNATAAALWISAGERAPTSLQAWGISLSLAVAWLILLRAFLVKPLRGLREPKDLAALLQQRGEYRNVLAAAEEACRLPQRWPQSDPIGAELRRRLLQRAAVALDPLTGRDAVVLRRPRWGWAGLAVAAALLTAQGALQPRQTARGLDRLARPWTVAQVDPSAGIYGEPGRGWVVAGATAVLAARDFGAGADAAVCEIRAGSGLWRPVAARGDPVPAPAAGLPAPYRRWVAEVADVREDFQWRFRRGRLVSEALTMAVRQHPRVTDLAATVTPPAYTQVPPQRWPALPTYLEIPAGSTVDLQGRLNHPVLQAWLAGDAGDSLTLAADTLQVSGTLHVERSLSFTLGLRDEADLFAAAPLRYELVAIPDAPPTVRLERPQDDGVLPVDLRVDLVAEAADDYGLQEVALLVRVAVAQAGTGGAPAAQADGARAEEAEGWTRARIWPDPAPQRMVLPQGREVALICRGEPEPERRSARLHLELGAAALGLRAGDVLEIAAAARDGKQPPPAGAARSRILRLAVPSAGQVLAEQMQRNEDAAGKLQDVRERSAQLQQDLQRMARELLKDPLPDWARRQELKAALERRQALQQELARLAEQLRRNLEELARGQLASPRQLELADRLAELLAAEPERPQDDLAQQLQEEGPGRPAPLVQEVERGQRETARRLDAALDLLNRMAAEQELDGLTAMLEKLMQRQHDLAEAARRPAGADSAAGQDPSAGRDGADPGQERPQDLAARQQDLASDLQDLAQRMEQALQDLRERTSGDPQKGAGSDSTGSAQLQDLERALEDLKRRLNEDAGRESDRQAMSMTPEQAAALQMQTMRNLGTLYRVLLQSQQAMQAAMQQAQTASLRGLAADLLALSTRQEEIAARVPAQAQHAPTADLARGQHRLQKAATGIRDRLSEVGGDVPMRILSMMAKLDGLIEAMGRGVQALQEGRGEEGRLQALASLAAANGLVIELLTEAQVSAGGGGGSQASAADQLLQMLKEQAELNGTTEELRRMLADRGLSQQTRAQMKRLGDAQGGLADRLQDLAEQQRAQAQGDRLLGDLQEMARDMQTVRDDIQEGAVDEQTLVRQERILSRMLDARNSARTRDYDKRRQSRTAESLYGDPARGAQDAPPGGGLQPRRLEPLLQAPPDYREMVRRYFAALDSLRLQPDLPRPDAAPAPALEQLP